MTFAKSHNSGLTDAVLATLSDAEYGYYHRLTNWCSLNETDGRFTVHSVSLLCQRRGSMKSLQRLVDVGLVSSNGPDYVLNRYLSEQTSKAKIDADRAAAAIRKQKSRGAGHTVTPTDPSIENREQRTESREQRVEVKKKPTVSKKRGKPATNPKVVRSSFCPESWEPTEKHRAEAGKFGITLHIEVMKFKNHEFKTPKSDWNRTFSLWIVNAYEHSLKDTGYRGEAKPPARTEHKSQRQLREEKWNRDLAESGRKRDAEKARGEKAS